MVKTRIITDPTNRFNELPTQIAYHLRRVEGNLVELAETGSIDGGASVPITDRLTALEVGRIDMTDKVDALRTTSISHTSQIQSLGITLGEVTGILESLPRGEPLDDWAAMIDATQKQHATTLSEIETEIGVKPNGYGSIWNTLVSHSQSLTALGGSITNLSNTLSTLADRVDTQDDRITTNATDIDALKTLTALHSTTLNKHTDLLDDLDVTW